ncbi:MAG TPA: glycosyltransferase, partial [Polyangiales bacterium]|nr:glycosyltransferase [Polyangiales bacterium]
MPRLRVGMNLAWLHCDNRENRASLLGEPMKIVDVAEFYAPRGGGVRTYIDLKLRAARAHGHELVVLAPGAEDREEVHASGRIIWVASPELPVDPRYRLLVRERAVHALLDREAPDIIEASSPWTGAWIAARYKAKHGRPVHKSLVYHHDPVAVYPQTWLGARFGAERVDRWCGGYWRYLQRLSSHFDLTLVSGPWLARRLAQHGVKNTRAVAFGVDKRVFSRAAPDAALRRELLQRAGAPLHAKLLITVSRLHPEKRLGTLMAAVEELHKTQPVALVVYGDGPFGSYYRRRARGLPIYFAGLTRDRAELARALASSDALLHGSSAETFGLVVAEAMCAGLPLIVPDAGGALEFVGNGYAESYRAGDAVGCARAAARLLQRDREQLRALSRKASETRVPSHNQHWGQLF